MADEMDVDQPKTKGKKEAKDSSSKARFEVKKVSNEHTHIWPLGDFNKCKAYWLFFLLVVERCLSLGVG